MSPSALKARFDASPEELRTSLNGVCDDGAALDAKVASIVTQTFGGAIHETMLDDPLATKINSKANESSVQTRLNEQARMLELTTDALNAKIADKCSLVSGTYVGDATASRYISLGFTPKAVLLLTGFGATVYDNGVNTYMGGLALANAPAYADWTSAVNIEVASGGFRVHYSNGSTPYAATNQAQTHYYYLAFR